MATSLWAVTALADEAQPAAAPGLVSTIINTLVVPLVTAFAAWVVHRVVKSLEGKVGMQLSQDKYAQLMDIVDHGIHYAAEQASKAGDKKLAGNDKLRLATTFVNDSVAKWGLDKVAQDRVQALIESRFSMKKAALGAAKKKT